MKELNDWHSWQPPCKILTRRDIGSAVDIEKSCGLIFPLTGAEIFTLTIGCYGLGGEAIGMLLKRADKDGLLKNPSAIRADAFFIYWTPNGRTGRFYYQKMREDDLYLIHLAVRKQFWRTGIGSLAIGWLKEELGRNRHLSRIVADIREDDRLSLNFLIKNKFKGEGVIRNAFPKFPEGQRDAYRLIYQPEYKAGGQPALRVQKSVRLDCDKRELMLTTTI